MPKGRKPGSKNKNPLVSIINQSPAPVIKNERRVSKLPKYLESGTQPPASPLVTVTPQLKTLPPKTQKAVTEMVTKATDEIAGRATPAEINEIGRWWSDPAAEEDIKALLSQMGADKITVFKRETTDPSYRGTGMAVCFLRFGVIQYLECSSFTKTALNLRQLYLAIKNLRLMESQGINYDNLRKVASLLPLPQASPETIPSEKPAPAEAKP